MHLSRWLFNFRVFEKRSKVLGKRTVMNKFVQQGSFLTLTYQLFWSSNSTGILRNDGCLQMLLFICQVVSYDDGVSHISDEDNVFIYSTSRSMIYHTLLFRSQSKQKYIYVFQRLQIVHIPHTYVKCHLFVVRKVGFEGFFEVCCIPI